MARVFFIGDLHLGHKNILKFRKVPSHITNVDDHDEWIKDNWNSVVRKRDLVYVMGDVCMDINKLHTLGEMRGRKKLVLGNHDKFAFKQYFKYFDDVFSMRKYKGYWLSHCPIHPQELRGFKNIHGHTHSKTINTNMEDEGIKDRRYKNVCVEKCPNYSPWLFEDIIKNKGE